jgi:type II secretion system protein I
MKQRGGLSLMEVILALAILGGSLAVIGELMRIGLRAAELSRNDTYAQLLCESKIAELASGIALPEPVVDEVLDPNGDWVHTVEVERSDDQTLMAVRVTVRPANQLATSQAFTLVRWMADPQIEYADREMQTERETAEDERIKQSQETSNSSTSDPNNSGLGNTNGSDMNNSTAGGLLPGNVRGFGNGGGRNQAGGQRGGADGGNRNGPPDGERGGSRNGPPNGPPNGNRNGPPNGPPPGGFGNGRPSPNFQPGGQNNPQQFQPAGGGFGGGRGS